MSDPKKTKQASADPSYGRVLDDIEALIQLGSKAAQEDVSSLPGSNHDEKTPEDTKGDYPLEPDPMSKATKSSEGKGDGTKAPTHDKSPQETDVTTPSSEQPGEMPMVTDTEDSGAGKQANELLRSIKTAGELLAKERGAAPAAAGQKKAQEGGGEGGEGGGEPGEGAPTVAEAAPGSDEKIAEYLNLTQDVLSKIAAVLLADESSCADTVAHLKRITNEKTAEEAISTLNNLGEVLEKQALEQQATKDADALYAELSKEAAELGLDVNQYVQALQQQEAALSKQASEQGVTVDQLLQAKSRSAPQARKPVSKQAATKPMSRGQKVAQAIIDAAQAGELPDEMAPELDEAEAAEIAVAEMLQSGEITPEEIMQLVAELEGEMGGAAMDPGMDPGMEGDMIDELVSDAAVPGDTGDVPDAVAADAAESVIPPEKVAGDKLAQLLAAKLNRKQG